jgi:transposase-like protein
MAKRAPRNPILDALRLASKDEASAVAFLEANRWGDSPACPRCGSTSVYRMTAKDGSRERNYRWRCRDCNRMYSVRTGLVLEESRLPLRIWVFAFWKACASKKGISALQISRECEISYKSALFLMHRIRFAMATPAGSVPKLTGTVEADETYVGGKPRYRVSRKDPESHAKLAAMRARKSRVFAVVQRGGQVRASTVASVTKDNLDAEMRSLVDLANARLITDESSLYTSIGAEFSGGHETVNHGQREYVRGDVTTNTIEGFFSLIKRGVYGTFHNVSKAHLHRYVAEFEFRWNHRKLDDGSRTVAAILNGEGKRLRYAADPQAA